MSLLLDALKKAAEQKAGKGKEEKPPARPSDETLLEGGDDASVREQSDDSDLSIPHHQLEDETELDQSELEMRLERAREAAGGGEDTGLDVPDPTELTSTGSRQIQTGEDETIVFDAEDVSEFLGEPTPPGREPRTPEDDTDLSQLMRSAEETDLSRAEPPAMEAGDETDLSELARREDETDHARPAPRGDETDLSELARREDETDYARPAPRDDETDLSQPLPPADETATGPATAGDDTDLSLLREPPDESGLGQPAAADSDVTDISHPQIRAGAPISDEDLSLYLAEQTGPTSATDPQVPGDPLAALQAGDDELALVDTTRHQLPAEETQTGASTQTTSSAPTRVRQDTETGVTEGATRRADATGTMTYAPDNYDRTLMKLPNDDASRLFAGMKSDSDVVMTPDYAKKVFRSKSSAQRMQHYKFYAGIAIAIVLAIGIYGVFEYQQEADTIDVNLQPLKRDPMPGIIQPAREKAPGLFAGAQPEVDERTLELVQKAETLENEAAPQEAVTEGGGEAEVEVTMSPDGSLSGVIAGEPESAAAAEPEPEYSAVSRPEPAPTVAAVAVRQPAATAASGSTTAPAVAASGSTTAPIAAASGSTAPIASAPATKTAAAATAGRTGTSSNLQISSNTRTQEKDLWLRQAWAAYQAGDDALALELYNRVLTIDPSNRNALLARAAIRVQNNDIAGAIEDYQALLLANPKDSLAMSSLISVTNFSPQETESRLKLMLRDEPDSPYLNFALANAFGAQNRWQEAQGYYFRALQNNPGDPNYAYNLAVSLEHIAKPGIAITYYQRALDNINNGLATFSREVVTERLEILRKL